MAELGVYVSRLAPKKETFLPGHRACIGCAEALAVRLVCKALGSNVIIANATGCMEIISSQIPFTSWGVPWIHTLFETPPRWLPALSRRERRCSVRGRYRLIIPK
ncbi:MAG: hypothetical protein WC369_02600 [Dehalococcoidales bacterium]